MATQQPSPNRNAQSSGRRRFPAKLGLFALGALLAGDVLAAPTVTAVTPANGSQNVALTSTLTFVFSAPMDTSVDAMPSIPPFLVGNLVVGPDSQVPMVSGTWSDDGLTLTCEFSADLPPNTTVTWTLNPAGAMFPFTGEDGAAVATTSGSFKTGAGGGGGGNGPKLLSSLPAAGATGVAVSTSVAFTFDQAMQKNPQVGGFPPSVVGGVAWTGTGLDATKFTYSWSTDGKTLTCDYSGDLPGGTAVTWVLNSAASLDQVRLKNEAGELLPVGTYSGTFTTAGSGGGCDPDGVPDTWGSYSVSKYAGYKQTSVADPVPASEDPFAFGVFVRGPQAGPAATGGSVTLPGGSSKPLESLFGFLSFNDTPATEAAWDAAYPAGNYTLRFTQTGQAERVIPMPLPASTTVPVPKIANFPAAQAVNAAQNFTLSWNAFAGAIASDYISLVISDGLGHVVFSAPDPCVPRELLPTATSIVIPAGTLASNVTYSATLAFGRTTYSSTNSVPEMAGFGGLSRSTDFTIKTTGGTAAADPARFTGYRLLPNGNPEMNLTGTASRTYTLQRTGSLLAPNWTVAGTVTMDATGKGVFQDTQAGKVLPLFYRAVATN